MCSDRGLTLEILDGESIAVKINKKCVISLASCLNPDHGGLGSFEITGLDPKKAASKKKSFWRRLWGKIKAAAGAVLDAVTVPIFGYRCRPDINVDIRGRGISFRLKPRKPQNVTLSSASLSG